MILLFLGLPCLHLIGPPIYHYFFFSIEYATFKLFSPSSSLYAIIVVIYAQLLQYSCLENSTDRGSWGATVHGIAESDRTKGLTLSSYKW